MYARCVWETKLIRAHFSNTRVSLTGIISCEVVRNSRVVEGGGDSLRFAARNNVSVFFGYNNQLTSYFADVSPHPGFSLLHDSVFSHVAYFPCVRDAYSRIKRYLFIVIFPFSPRKVSYAKERKRVCVNNNIYYILADGRNDELAKYIAIEIGTFRFSFRCVLASFILLGGDETGNQ